MSRFVLAFWTMLAVASGAELVRAWPAHGASGGFAFALAIQVIAFGALWTAPVAGLVLGGVHLWRRVRPAGGPAPGWLVLVPPAVFACAALGQLVHAWSARSFVRQDLAGAVVPLILLAVFAAIAGATAATYRFVRAPLARAPAWVPVAGLAGGAVVFGAIHVARFPALLDDARIPVLLQLAVVAACGVAALAIPRRPGRIALGATVAAVAVAAGLTLFGGRVAPLSYPMAASALQARGLAAAQVARLTVGVGDGDGDGFSRLFGGADCDDGDPNINPLATDIPDNGVDEDCFDGDLRSDDVARARAERLARRGPPRQRVRNVVLVTIDTLRADAVGFGGAEHPSSPRLDALAARGAVFTRAYTPAPMTRRAFPALLAGRYPSNIHWLDLQTNYVYTVAHADNELIAEVARDAGLRTGAVLAFSYAKLGHFDQGLQLHTIHAASRSPRETNADKIVDDAIAALRGWAGAPERPRFLLWVHFYEAHYPYEKHAGIDFGNGDRDRYLGEVRWIDGQLGRLFDELEALGLAGDTAIVFASDHGEEFGEHGDKWHGDLYPEDLHVPMFVYVPGGEPRSLDTPVSLVDVAPTILELLGLAIPASYDGDSLLPWIEGTEPPPADRAVFAELIPDAKVERRIVALIDSRWHYIADFRHGGRELYDLRADPTAQRNLLTDAPAAARAAEEKLRRFMALTIGPLRVSLANGG